MSDSTVTSSNSPRGLLPHRLTRSGHDKTIDRHISLTALPEEAQVLERTEASDAERRKFERNLIWKIDLIVMPLATITYFLASMGRSDLANAKLAGMTNDLDISDKEYSTAASIFYIGYLIFQLPACWLLQKMTPPIQLGGALLVWGAATIGLGFAKNYQTVLALRFIIGGGEAFIQGGILYLTILYTPRELALRISIVWATSALAAATNGLLAYGIELTLEGRNGLRSWQWLFLIEGILPLVFSVVIYVFLPSTPEKLRSSKFFSPAQSARMMERSKAGHTTGHTRFQPRLIATSLLADPIFWLLLLLRCSVDFAQTGLSNFLPIIVNGLGLGKNDVNGGSSAEAQAYSVIPYAIAFVATIASAYLCDRYAKTAYTIAVCAAVAAVGYVLVLAVDVASPAGRFVGLCLIGAGLFPCVALVIVWTQNLIVGYVQRSTATGLSNAIAQAVSIGASQTYQDPPRYVKGNATALGLVVFSVIITVGLRCLLVKMNAAKDSRKEQLHTSSVAETQLVDEESNESRPREPTVDELGNKYPDFRFMY